MPRTLTSDLSQRQYAAIGKVACEWAHLENMLQYYVRAITDLDQDLCFKVTAELGFISLLNLVFSILYDEKLQEQSPLYQHLKAAEPALNDLRVRRNGIVHGGWLKDGKETAAALRIAQKGALKATVATSKLSDVESLAIEISEMHTVLIQHLLRHQDGTLAPLPSKRQRQPQKGQMTR